jgi:biopolymer transport protein ExbB
MVPLFVCSIAVWGVVVERLWALRGWREKNREFLLSFSNLWLRGDREGARKLCERSQVELAEIARELVGDQPTRRKEDMTRDEVLDERLFARLERRRLEQSAELRRFLWVLGTIGSAAPFIGLFGTVIGIIKAFTTMAEAGTGGFNVVAAGISEALVATAAGIVVAVIAVFFYNYFQVKVGQLQFQLKHLCEEMLEIWDSKGSA